MSESYQAPTMDEYDFIDYRHFKIMVIWFQVHEIIKILEEYAGFLNLSKSSYQLL